MWIMHEAKPALAPVERHVCSVGDVPLKSMTPATGPEDSSCEETVLRGWGEPHIGFQRSIASAIPETLITTTGRSTR